MKRDSGPVVVNMIVEERRQPPLEDIHPCQIGQHRPAYLAAGGIACGYCGVRL